MILKRQHGGKIKMENELVLRSNVTPAILDINFDELEAGLNEKMDEYRNLIVTEDSLKGAKHAKQELASLRTNLEDSRKRIKKEAEAPIKLFDERCKKIKAIIEETEKPLNEAIETFDEKKRDEKKKFAQECIAKAIVSYELRDNFAGQMEMRPEYITLNCTKKSVKEGITAQAEQLKKLQDAEDEKLTAVRTAVANENQRLKIKLNEEEFSDLIRRNWTLSDVLEKIKKQADNIYEQEHKEEELAQDATPLFMPEMPQDTVLPDISPVMQNIAVSENIQIPADFAIPVAPLSEEVTSVQNPVPEKKESEFEVTFKIKGGFTALKVISDYLKNSGVELTVLSQIKL